MVLIEEIGKMGRMVGGVGRIEYGLWSGLRVGGGRLWVVKFDD